MWGSIKQKEVQLSYWRIVHNLVRQDETQQEVDRATEACVWLAENFTSLRKVCSTQQIEILSYIYTFWYNHKSAPSFSIIKETLERKSASPGVLEVLAEYDEEEGLTVITAKDMGQLLVDLIEEWQSDRLAVVLKTTRTINNGTWTDPKTKLPLSGPKDAAKYLMKQVEEGMIFTSSQAANLTVNEDGDKLGALYAKLKADRLSGNLRIGTGLPEIDSHIAIKRGDFVGVLGYAGQRKSTLCRTFAYNAARRGFNVLHVSLEQTCEEELIIYGLMHSVVEPKFRKWGVTLSKSKFDDGDLSEAEEKFLMDVVIPDLKNLPGRLLIRQPTDGTTWTNIKTMAEVVNQTTPIDLFFVDYLALVSTTSARESKSEMEMNIKDAKQTALQFDNGRGVVFLTPIQGNRKGYEEAKDLGGVWDMTGVYEYSEFDKSADLIFSTFIDPDLAIENAVAISTVKIRRAAPLPLFKAPLDSNVGMVGNLSTINYTKDEYLVMVTSNV